MLAAIDLNDQLRALTCKIHDEGTKGNLSSKMRAIDRELP
jgi:hypothetical protein